MHTHRLKQLTNSNKLFTYYQKKNANKKKKVDDDIYDYGQDEQTPQALEKKEDERLSRKYNGSREDYWLEFLKQETGFAMAFDFLVRRSLVSELTFIKSEMFMVELDDSLAWLQIKDKIQNVRILQNLCEGNCTFFKQFLFFREYEDDVRQGNDRKFTIARYLIDKLAYFTQFINRKKMFLGFEGVQNSFFSFESASSLYRRNEIVS